MKILLIQDQLRSGGTERQTLALAHAFNEAGHFTRVLPFRPGGALAEVGAGVTLDPLQSTDLGLDWFAPGILNRIREYGPDVVLTMGRMANCYGEIIHRRVRSAVVVGTLRTGKALPWLYRRSICAVPCVVANSRQAALRLRDEFKVKELRIRVIHNALVFAPQLQRTLGAPEAAVREQLGAGPGTLALLCVAMFRKEKNQRDVIAAAAALPRALPWQVWFIGEGETLAQCEQQAKELGIADRVRFLGFQKDPSPYYRAADLAVLTSKAESLSNFLIEAQAHGLPAVAYDVQGVRECFIDGESGHAIPFGDRAALVQGLQGLLEDHERRTRFAAAARNYAQASFSAESQAGQYLQLFQELLGAR